MKNALYMTENLISQPSTSKANTFMEKVPLIFTGSKKCRPISGGLTGQISS